RTPSAARGGCSAFCYHSDRLLACGIGKKKKREGGKRLDPRRQELPLAGDPRSARGAADCAGQCRFSALSFVPFPPPLPISVRVLRRANRHSAGLGMNIPGYCLRFDTNRKPVPSCSKKPLQLFPL
ncbi:unnamed protein product, partial [Bubo scandiacus]